MTMVSEWVRLKIKFAAKSLRKSDLPSFEKVVWWNLHGFGLRDYNWVFHCSLYLPCPAQVLPSPMHQMYRNFLLYTCMQFSNQYCSRLSCYTLSESVCHCTIYKMYMHSLEVYCSIFYIMCPTQVVYFPPIVVFSWQLLLFCGKKTRDGASPVNHL